MRFVRHHEHGAPSVLRIEEAQKPQPGPGQVLIRAEDIGVTVAEVQRRQGNPVGGHADEGWVDQVLAATDGRGADQVQTVGGGVLLKSPGSTARFGTSSSAPAPAAAATSCRSRPRPGPA